MKIQIKNNTKEILSIIPNIEIGVSDEYVTYFDSNDDTTYNIGYVFIKLSYLALADLVDSNDIEVLWDGKVVETGQALISERDLTYNKLFVSQPFNYEQQDGKGIYFGLEDNTLRVYNPINEKWYKIQMVEDD